MEKMYVIDNKEIMSEWDWEHNNKEHIFPEKITVGSNKKINLICNKGHKYITRISHRNDGHKCPYCANQKVMRGFNDLEFLYPDIAKEWDCSKNEKKTTQVLSGSGKKAWWICEKGHSYEAQINNRILGTGCPYCKNKKLLKGFNDLETKNPVLAKEWNYEKNDIKPYEIIDGSHKKVWWKCQICNFEWNAKVESRKRGAGCPMCSETKRLNSYNDKIINRSGCFADSGNEFLLKEWNYEKNKNELLKKLSLHSSKKVWWKCSFCGHEWECSIDNRYRGRGCPTCALESKTSFPEQAIFYYIKRIYKDTVNRYVDKEKKISEIDIYIPSLKVGVEYDGQYWHKNKKTIDKHKDTNAKECGILLYRIKEIRDNELYYSQNKFYYNPSSDDNLNNVIKLLIKKAFNQTNIDINITRDRHKILEQYIFGKKSNNLQEKYPKIASEWAHTKNGNLRAENFSSHSNKKAWWICEKGHLYESSINNRVNGTGCPYCSNQKVLEGYNDLKTKCPKLLEEWDYDKNIINPNQITSNSNKKVWWKCKNNHEWEANINNRIKGAGCPICCNLKVQTGYNDLKSKFPQILIEWNYERNQEYKPEQIYFASSKKVWWKCSNCKHEWITSIQKRTIRLQGCPKCYCNLLKENKK